MKTLLFLLLAVVGMNFTCKKAELPLPTCIQVRIDSIKAQPKWNPPAEVTEYLYKGKTVYGFSSDCCDQYYTVFDSECNYICAPSGGITGGGDGKCADFQQNAKMVRVVFKDNR